MTEIATDLTVLPPSERAAIVLNSSKTEQDLAQLASILKAIVLVNSPAGRDQAHAMAMTARNARTTIEKAGKSARDDATKFSKAVIAEEKRLIDLIEPEENRVLGLRNAWDAAEAARKEAIARAERERIERHQAVITQIKSYPYLAREARTSEMALSLLEKMHGIDLSGLEEFENAAADARIEADDQFDEIIKSKQAQEAEALQIKMEQEAESARLAQERQRIEAERQEQLRIQAERDAELKAQQDRINAQQAELNRRAAEIEAKEEESKRLEAAQVKKDEDSAKTQELREVQVDVQIATPEIVSTVARPSDEEIMDVLVNHYGESKATVLGWLVDFDANEVIKNLTKE